MKNRILSIDGGGIRGLLPAYSLAALEKQLGKPVRECFDMVAGTSTGALLAAAVAVGLPATRILDIYRTRTPEIFNHSAAIAWAKRLNQGYSYDPANIYRLLRDEFGEAADWTLNDSPIKILLTARHVGNRPMYFVKDGPKNARTMGKLSLAQCATASAAAPTYFHAYYVSPLAGQVVGWCYDGGVGTTGNPVYQACVEAFCYDDYKPEETVVVSLGTGFYPDLAVNPPQGLVQTISWTVNALTSSAHDEQTELVQRHWPGILQRFDWQLPAAIDMADVSAVPALMKVAQEAVTINWAAVLG